MPIDGVNVELQNSGGMANTGADWTNRPVVHLQKVSGIGNVWADWTNRPGGQLQNGGGMGNAGAEWTNRPERHLQNGVQMPIGGITIDLQNSGDMPNAGPDWTNRPERHLQNGGGMGNARSEWTNRQGSQHGRATGLLPSAISDGLTDVTVTARNTEWGGGTAKSKGQSLQSSSNQNGEWLGEHGNRNAGWIDMAGDRWLFDRVGPEGLQNEIAVGGNHVSPNGKGTATESIGMRDSSIGFNGGEQFFVDVGPNIETFGNAQPNSFTTMDTVGHQVIGRPNFAHVQQRQNWVQPLERRTFKINPSNNHRTPSHNTVVPMVFIVHLQGHEGTETELSNVGNAVPSTGVNGLPVSRNIGNRNLVSNGGVGGGVRSNGRLVGQGQTNSRNMFAGGSESSLGMTKNNFNSRRFGNQNNFGDTRSNSIMSNEAPNNNKFLNRQRMTLNGLNDASRTNFNVNGVQRSLDGMSIDTSNLDRQRSNMLASNIGAFGKVKHTPLPQALGPDPWNVSSLTRRRDFRDNTRPNGDPSSVINDNSNRLVRQKSRLYGRKVSMQLYGKPKASYGTRNAKSYGKLYVPYKKRYGKFYKKQYGKKVDT
ncbi:unnamed protein product [Mytilus coruscus]|uniref:Uncharacterized protein n=1 Tax=Mytilus coruscus TaxID=42192 RepID=A0A6J8ARH0_MYTCO|nr:unnamed protein product [Mytilus coruscus]